MSVALSAGLTAMLAIAGLIAYAIGWTGAVITPAVAMGAGVLGGVLIAWRVHQACTPSQPPLGAWVLVVGGALAALLAPFAPALLPPGGAADLTHHLMLVDRIERTWQLVRDGALDAYLGEMAHYTPGLHLLTAMAGAAAGVDAYRTVYPLLAMTLALKAGVVFLLAYDALAPSRARLPLALSAVALVLFAPRPYTIDGFLQAGFYAQVASELFVVAGWWALARWWHDARPVWMAYGGVMAAAAFLVWPIWIGPLMVAVVLAVAQAGGRAPGLRARAIALGVVPVLVVAAMHLSQHAAYMGVAGTSGAVPPLAAGPTGWVLIVLACVGLAASGRQRHVQVTVWFSAAVLLQGAALWALASARGAETPYMAMKMVYLAVYPAAVLAALALSWLVRRLPMPAAFAWALTVSAIAVAVRTIVAAPAPPRTYVDVDLDAAGRWARAHLPAACVDYVVGNADQAYWLHLAVMGQPRQSPRTADIDGYTANRAVGRWIEGSALPYAIARQELLPGEVLRDADVIGSFGTAVVIRRRNAACPADLR
jgi:hypothetical protein